MTDIVWTAYYKFGQHVQPINPYTSYRIPDEKNGASTKSMAGNLQISRPSILGPLRDDELKGWEVGLWCIRHAGQPRMIPADSGRERGSCSRDFSPYPPRVLVVRKTKVCHLLAGVIPSVDGEMISVPVEDEPFVRGLSK